MLSSIYRDARNPAGLSSAEKLYRAAKQEDPSITREQIKDYLQSEFIYTLHYPARRHWERNRVVVSAPNIQGQADLCDLKNYERQNDGYKYLLTFVDCFSRYGAGRPLRTKRQEEVADALISILAEHPVHKLQTDQGTEFKNSFVRKALAKRGTYLFHSINQDIKCAEVERMNRTIKSRMFKMFTSRGIPVWYNKLDDIFHAYNNSVHRTIGLAPAAVTLQNTKGIFKRLYDGLPDEQAVLRESLLNSVSNEKFKPGDMVRLRYYLHPFEHKYFPNYDDRYFIIDRIIKGYPKNRFRLRLWEDNSILRGSHYAEELQHVKHGEYRINVKGRRRRRGHTEFYVEYLGYPKKFDAWVTEDQLRSLGASISDD